MDSHNQYLSHINATKKSQEWQESFQQGNLGYRLNVRGEKEFQKGRQRGRGEREERPWKKKSRGKEQEEEKSGTETLI